MSEFFHLLQGIYVVVVVAYCYWAGELRREIETAKRAWELETKRWGVGPGKRTNWGEHREYDRSPATALTLGTEALKILLWWMHFNGEGHTLANMTVVEIGKIRTMTYVLQNMGKQVDQDLGDLISFWNEPRGLFPVKPAWWLSDEDPMLSDEDIVLLITGRILVEGDPSAWRLV